MFRYVFIVWHHWWFTLGKLLQSALMSQPELFFFFNTTFSNSFSSLRWSWSFRLNSIFGKILKKDRCIEWRVHFLSHRVTHLHPESLPAASHAHHLHPCPQQAELFVSPQQPLYHRWQAGTGDWNGFLLLRRLHRYASPTPCQSAAWNRKRFCSKKRKQRLSHPHRM